MTEETLTHTGFGSDLRGNYKVYHEIKDDGMQVNKKIYENGYWVRRETDKHYQLLLEETSLGGFLKNKYDEMGRVTYREERMHAVAPIECRRYEYDANGNITLIDHCNGTWQRWEYDAEGKAIKGSKRSPARGDCWEPMASLT